MSMAYARSLEKVPTFTAEVAGAPSQSDAPDTPDTPPAWAYALAQAKGCYDALAGNRVFVMFAKYCFVLAVGSAWFLLHPEERSQQQENGVEMTAVDAAFFATVRRLKGGGGGGTHPTVLDSVHLREECTYLSWLKTRARSHKKSLG